MGSTQCMHDDDYYVDPTSDTEGDEGQSHTLRKLFKKTQQRGATKLVTTEDLRKKLALLEARILLHTTTFGEEVVQSSSAPASGVSTTSTDPEKVRHVDLVRVEESYIAENLVETGVLQSRDVLEK